jgi:hypothetical protein
LPAVTDATISPTTIGSVRSRNVALTLAELQVVGRNVMVPRARTRR